MAQQLADFQPEDARRAGPVDTVVNFHQVLAVGGERGLQAGVVSEPGLRRTEGDLLAAGIVEPHQGLEVRTQPLSLAELAACIVALGLVFVAIEIDKYRIRRRMRRGCSKSQAG